MIARWQPISEAPDDMREIVLGHWVADTSGHGQAWESAIGFRHGVNFSTLETDLKGGFLRRGDPTHFLDLPVPPGARARPVTPTCPPKNPEAA